MEQNLLIVFTVESTTQQRRIGSIADYEPQHQANSVPHSYQNTGGVGSSGVSSRQRQEWEETVPMSSAQTQCKYPPSSVLSLAAQIILGRV